MEIPAKKSTFNLNRERYLSDTTLYFVEHLLLLILLTIGLSLFDSVIFTMFGYLVTRGVTGAGWPFTLVGAPLIAAVFVLVPVLLFFWTRVRRHEARNPAVLARRARRYPVYAFILLQALIAVGLAITFVSALVSGVISGFSGFGALLVVTALPALFATAVHALAAYLSLGTRPAWERTFVVAGGAGLFIVAFILLVVFAANQEAGRSPLLDTPRESEDPLFEDRDRIDRFDERDYFNY